MLFKKENSILEFFSSQFNCNVPGRSIFEEYGQVSDTLKEQQVEQPNNSASCDIHIKKESKKVDVETVGPCRIDLFQDFVLPKDLREKLINNPRYENWDSDLREAVKRFKIKKKIPLNERYHLRIAPCRYITLPEFYKEKQTQSVRKKERHSHIQRVQKSEKMAVQKNKPFKKRYYRLPKELRDKLINQNWDRESKQAVNKYIIKNNIPRKKSSYIQVAIGEYVSVLEFTERRSSNMDINRASKITQFTYRSHHTRIDSRSSKKRKIIRHMPPIECQLSLLPKDLLVKFTNQRKFQDWDDDLKKSVEKFRMDNNFPLKRKVRVRVAPGEYIVLPIVSNEKVKHIPSCKYWKPETCIHNEPVTCTHKKPAACTHKKPVTYTHKKPLASAQLNKRMATSRSKQIDKCISASHFVSTMGPEAPDSDSETDVSSLSSDDEDFPSTSIFDSDPETDEVSSPSNVHSTSTSFANQIRSDDAVFVPPASPPWSMPDDLRDRLMQNVGFRYWDEELKEAVREFKLKRKFPLEKTIRMRIAPEKYITLPGFPQGPQRGVDSVQKLKPVMKTDKQLHKIKSEMKCYRCNAKKKCNRSTGL